MLRFMRLVVVEFVGIFFAASFISIAHAQPSGRSGNAVVLSAEDQLTEAGKFRFEGGMTFSARSLSRPDSAYNIVETSPGTFVSVPSTIGASKRDSDIGVLMFGLRYGITNDTELYVRASGSADSTRSTDIFGAVTTKSVSKFNDAVVGVSHRFVKPAELPGLIGFADISVVENPHTSSGALTYGRSGNVGFTAYQVHDPLILSVTAGYRFFLDRRVDGLKINPGDLFYVSPSIAFLVNPRVTLYGGMTIKSVAGDKVPGLFTGARSTRADLDFGVGYGLSKSTSLRFDFRASVLGNEGISAGISFVQKLN